MGSDIDRGLVQDLARPLVSRFAPAERGELFELLSDAWFDDPRAAARSRARGGPLSFGIPEVAVLLTPLLLAALSQVVDHLAGQALSKGLRLSADAVRRLLRRDGAGPPAEPELDLSPQQWAEIHRIVERVVGLGGVPPGQARLIADAVVGEGRLGPQTDDPPDEPPDGPTDGAPGGEEPDDPADGPR